MSRSYRKNPYCGWVGAESEKEDKRIANRRLRHHQERQARRIRLAASEIRSARMREDGHLDEEISKPLPTLKEVSDIYGFAKDGKQRMNVKPGSLKWDGSVRTEAEIKKRLAK